MSLVLLSRLDERCTENLERRLQWERGNLDQELNTVIKMPYLHKLAKLSDKYISHLNKLLISTCVYNPPVHKTSFF